jgi:hypothetical protein
MRSQQPSGCYLAGAALLTSLLLVVGLVVGYFFYLLAFLGEFDSDLSYAPGAESVRHFWDGLGIGYALFLAFSCGLLAVVALLTRGDGGIGLLFAAGAALGMLSQAVALHFMLLHRPETTWFDVAVQVEVVAVPALLVALARAVRGRGSSSENGQLSRG